MRLCNYLKTNLNLTRKEILNLNSEGLIKVNNELKPLTYKLNETDQVFVNNKLIKDQGLHYFLYYKPKGVLSVCSSKENSYLNYLNLPYKVVPAGRLDKDSEGLLFLTNDGKMINLISSPKTHFEKEYLVEVKEKITEEFMENIKKPVILNNRLTKELFAEKLDDYHLKMILTEGIYHQIRRIVKMNHNYVVNLKRIRIGNYLLDGLKPNELKEIKIITK